MHLRTVKEFAALVRSRRLAAGLTQEALAKRAGLTRLWVVQFEGGKETVEFGLVLRVLRALDITIEAIAREDLPEPEIDLDRLLDEQI